MNEIQVPSDRMRVSRICERHTAENGTPLSLGDGVLQQYEVSDDQATFWNRLSNEDKIRLGNAQYEGCFLCALENEVSSSTLL